VLQPIIEQMPETDFRTWVETFVSRC
jgi:hypothetical protein